VDEFVRVETDHAVATIRLDRPPMNALSADVLHSLGAAASQVSADPAVRSVVLTGGQKIFAAGADVKEMSAQSYAQMVATHSRLLQDTFRAVAAIGKPVIAAITGYALGGGLELALCADFRIMGQGARVGQPEILLGIMPGAGGTQNLPRAVGMRRAKELILTGQPFTAAQAEDWGLVNQVVPLDALLKTTLATARRIAENAPISIRQAKQSMHRGLQMSLWDALAFEIEAYNRMVPTDDRREGINAFNEKRKAVFRGR